MRDDPQSGIRRATLALAALAVMAVELTLAESRTFDAVLAARIIGWTSVMLGAAALTTRFARRDATETRAETLPPFVVAALVVLFALPWGIEITGLLLGSRMSPMELITLASIRNVAVGFAVASVWQQGLRFAGVTSLFAVIASAVLAEHPWVVGIVLGFVCVGVAWLVLWHAHRRCVAGGVRRTPSIATTTTLAFGIGAVVALSSAFLPDQARLSLWELVPSSGGSREPRNDARRGVGEGPDAGGASEHARSAQHTDEDVFLKSHLPSLLDVLTEQYGEPATPDKIERAIPLQPDQKMVVERMQQSDTATPNERFELRRMHRPDQRGEQSETDTALLYVNGPVPAHLRTVVYDRFDGSTWYRAKTTSRAPNTNHFGYSDEVWMSIAATYGVEVYHDEPRRHTVRFAGLETDELPVPDHVISFHIPRIDDRSFFGWSDHDTLKLIRDIPQGDALYTISRRTDWALMNDARFRRGSQRDDVYVTPKAAELAQRWTREAAPGWPQVEAIVIALRQRCALDHHAMPPVDHPDVVGQFLDSTRRGPDYLFASSAAVMLRSLGFETRLVQGFYASHNRYDWFRRNTPVLTDDFHIWLEVQLADGVWVTVEPSPGYRVEAPPHWLYAALDHVGAALWSLGTRYWHWCIAALFALSLAYVRRAILIDWLLTCAWRVRQRRTERNLIVDTLALLESRCWLAGRERPYGATISRWLSGLDTHDAEPSLTQFAALVSRHLYAAHASSESVNDDRQFCKQVAAHWSLDRIRSAATNTE